MTLRILSWLLIAALAEPAIAATHGHGRVQIQGTILDTACAISTGDADQSIDLGTLSASDLLTNNRGPAVLFTVHLVNCVLNGGDVQGQDHWKDVRITFDGIPDSPHRFALQGKGRGEALVIANESGNEAQPGEAMPATGITPGSMALHYRLWLTPDHHALRPGRFYTTLRYFMEYD